ncbi:MAG: sensor histidine kinase [Bryobacterales bacterium]|jgi:two-component system, NtrC family, sensor histidine kinase HydH|nr:sensor histidine kinase [Bryobacterales bacterium]
MGASSDPARPAALPFSYPPAPPSQWPLHVLFLAVCLLAGVHWLVPVTEVQKHNFLHHLSFIPVVIAGALFGWRSAGLLSLFAIAVHSPHLWKTWQRLPVPAMDNLVEMSIFGIAGVITGFLSERERGQRHKLERTKHELERVYGELRQNVERLTQAERLSAVGQLAAGLAHEIRNPLASIAGAAGILQRGHAPVEDQHDCLEIIDKESQRLNKLLSSFLDFARPRTPRFQRTDVHAVLDSVAVLASHTAGAGGVEFRRVIPGDLPDIECDPEQLKQVLLNLFINAVQASPRGGTIEVRAALLRDRVRITVRDQGSGIPPELRSRIFDPFYTTKESGNGLGLAVAAKIVEQHGGLLVAEGGPGSGAILRLDLPLDRTRPL